jgi:hypothetical protein
MKKNRPMVYFFINLFLNIINQDKNNETKISKLSSNHVVGNAFTSTFHIVTPLFLSHDNHAEFKSISHSLSGVKEVSAHKFTT